METEKVSQKRLKKKKSGKTITVTQKFKLSSLTTLRTKEVRTHFCQHLELSVILCPIKNCPFQENLDNSRGRFHQHIYSQLGLTFWLLVYKIQPTFVLCPKHQKSSIKAEGIEATHNVGEIDLWWCRRYKEPRMILEEQRYKQRALNSSKLNF